MEFTEVRDSLVCLLFSVIILCGCVRQDSIGLAVQPAVTQAASLGVAVTSFRQAHAHWPQSREELLRFLRDHQIQFDDRQFKVIDFSEQADGSLRVTYETDHARGTMTLDSQADLVMQRPREPGRRERSEVGS